MSELYGPEHYDSPYFGSLKNWLSTQKFSRGIELGFAWGMSALAYLETQDSNLISIDLNDDMAKADKIKDAYGDRFTLILGDSSTTLLKQSGRFDYIYIDGDHSYEGVGRDLSAALKKVAKGGVIVCDDYGNSKDVKRAVDEFCKKNKFDLEPIAGNPNGGMVIHA